MKNTQKAENAAESAYFLSKFKMQVALQNLKPDRLLGAANRWDLQNTTLLTPAIHKKHSDQLAICFLKQWAKIETRRLNEWDTIPRELRRGTPAPNNHQIADDHVRFFTLLDSVTVVSSDAAFSAAIRMKESLIKAIESTKGIWCLGAVEAEVVNLKLMKEIRDKDANAPSEKRKLSVCESLVSEYQNTIYQNETNFFLVHFHGLLTAKSAIQFESLRSTLRLNAQWTREPRQIEIKKLSKEFFGAKKTVEHSLKDIAKYITKGGNDWVNQSIAFRYKVGFSQFEDYADEDEYVQRNWRRDEALKLEHKHEGIDDAFSLTGHEIAELAIFIPESVSRFPARPLFF